ncbi:MAG: hypothetical protein M3323_07645 [Actinomycetota bacterium]|nr:hypothetical protein [Actinomycetota bacterium]
MTRDPETIVREAFAGLSFDRPVAQIVSAARRRRQRRRIAFGAVPALGILAAGGTAILSSDRISASNVACFDSADPEALPFGAFSPRTTGERPEKLCAKEWRQGFLPYEPILDRGDAPFPVPPLTACAIEDGGVGVFPTDDEDFCTAGPVARQMGLSEVPDDYHEHIDRYVALRSDAAERLRETAVRNGGSEDRACLSEDEATSVALGVLADHGYEGWTVRVVHSKEDAPCWMHLNFENPEREVVVYSTERGAGEIWVDDGAAFPQE